MFCTKCCKEISDGQKFCVSCGARIEYSKESAAQSWTPQSETLQPMMSREQQQENGSRQKKITWKRVLITFAAVFFIAWGLNMAESMISSWIINRAISRGVSKGLEKYENALSENTASHSASKQANHNQVKTSGTGQSNVSIPFEEQSYSFTDESGYKLDVSMRISPWISQSDTEAISSAWGAIGRENYIPTIEGLFLEKTQVPVTGNNGVQWYKVYKRDSVGGGGPNSFMCESDNFEMYYAIGEIRIKNKTPNFPITESNPKSVHFYIDSPLFIRLRKLEWGNVLTAPVMARAFFGEKNVDYTQNGQRAICMKVSMNSDENRLTFMLIHGESRTPNEPDGIYGNDLDESHLRFSCSQLGTKIGLLRGSLEETPLYSDVPNNQILIYSMRRFGKEKTQDSGEAERKKGLNEQASKVDLPDDQNKRIHENEGETEATITAHVITQIARVTSSSELSGGDYDAHNVLEETLDTAWVEGVEGDGINEYLEFYVPDAERICMVEIASGYHKSKDLFEKNGAPTEIILSSGDESRKLYLYPSYGETEAVNLDTPLYVENGIVRLTISAVRTGSKYEDSCISRVVIYEGIVE